MEFIWLQVQMFQLWIMNSGMVLKLVIIVSINQSLQIMVEQTLKIINLMTVMLPGDQVVAVILLGIIH